MAITIKDLKPLINDDVKIHLGREVIYHGGSYEIPTSLEKLIVDHIWSEKIDKFSYLIILASN